MPATREIKETAPAASRKRVLILEDLPIVRERMAELIQAEPKLSLCGQADDARIAMQLIATTQPDLVVTSLSLKNAHGLDFVKDVHSRHPHLLILVFSLYDELVYAERAIRAGARGFIRKQESSQELLRAIHYVLEGEIYMSERVTVTKVTRFFSRSSIKEMPPLEGLSDREIQVLQLIGHGQSTREIASALHIDVKTIETYRARIKVKLDLNSASELARYARKWLEASIGAGQSP